MESYCNGGKYFTSEEIFYQDAGVVTLGSEELRYLLADILTRIPGEIVEDVYFNCRFLMPRLEELGSYLPNSVIKDKHLFAFHSGLLKWSKEKQIQVILHEIAHYVLGHKAIFEAIDVDWRKQEKEADSLRDKWLDEWSKEKS